MVGKRPAGGSAGWNNLSGMWGKRAKWNELSGMWGKRGWNDMSGGWGKSSNLKILRKSKEVYQKSFILFNCMENSDKIIFL